MQLNEIIEENTLPSISRKTRISVQNLEALLARDWSRLKKVQALGFISILEREYRLDLSGMREECRAYFDQNASAEDEGGPVMATTADHGGGGLPRSLIIVIAIALGVGGSVLFFSTESVVPESNETAPKRQSGFFDSVLQTARGWFESGEERAVVETAEAEEVPALKGAWAEENRSGGGEAVSGDGEKRERSAVSTGAAGNGQPAGARESNVSPDMEEARIIQQVKKEQAKAEEIRQKAGEETNLTPDGNEKDSLTEISKMILAATAAGEAPAEGEAMETRVPSLKKKEERADSGGADGLPAEAAESAAKKQPSQPAATVDMTVVMHPRSKIWVGYTNLRDMKRIAKVTADDITFDTATGDYILAVGHGQIDFKTAEGEKRLNDGKRHFFMIAKGGVREISHEEFQRLNKSKVW